MKIISLPDGREITYELTRKRVKNVNMHIKPDGIVYVSANTRISIKRIEEILTERADFILTSVEKLRQRESRSEISTEKINWLGQEYPVRIIRNSTERVALEDSEIRVFTVHPELAEKLLTRWIIDSFTALVSELNDEVRKSLTAAGLNPPPTRITIKDMKTRWGSCSYSRGHISINLRLMAYPRETVKSVVWHEYAHYWHYDHSVHFYAFLKRHYPQYHRWNDLLKK